MSKAESPKRHMRESLKRRQNQFWIFNSKRRALGLLFKNMNNQNINRMRKQYVKKVFLKQIFNAWTSVLDRLKRKRLLTESAQLIRTTSLTEGCFRALAEYAARRVNARVIIERFQERSELVLKTSVLLELHANIQFKQYQRNTFVQRMSPYAESRMVQPFAKWCDFVAEAKREDKADEFYRKRGAQFLYRLTWDTLLMYSLNKKHEDAQHQAVDGWHAKFLLQKGLLSLKLYTHDSKRIRNVSKVVTFTSAMSAKRIYFDAFRDAIIASMFSTAAKQKAQAFYFQNAARKVLIGFQVTSFRK